MSSARAIWAQTCDQTSRFPSCHLRDNINRSNRLLLPTIVEKLVDGQYVSRLFRAARPKRPGARSKGACHSGAARQFAAATLGFARLPANAIDNTADQQDCEYAPPCYCGHLGRPIQMALDRSCSKERTKSTGKRLDALVDILMDLP